jgi:hypothetical protein
MLERIRQKNRAAPQGNEIQLTTNRPAMSRGSRPARHDDDNDIPDRIYKIHKIYKITATETTGRHHDSGGVFAAKSLCLAPACAVILSSLQIL